MYRSSYGFPGGLAGKESIHNMGDLGSIPGLGRSPREGKGYPLQYSGLENSMDCSPWGRKESDTTERLSHLTHNASYSVTFLFLPVFCLSSPTAPTSLPPLPHFSSPHSPLLLPSPGSVSACPPHSTPTERSKGALPRRTLSHEGAVPAPAEDRAWDRRSRGVTGQGQCPPPGGSGALLRR